MLRKSTSWRRFKLPRTGPGTLMLNKKDPMTSTRKNDPNADALNARRYEHVRKMSAHAFAELYQKNLQTGIPFDQLVDEQRTAAAAEREGDAASSADHPPLGSPAWFKVFSGGDAERARKFVADKHPVIVVENTDTGTLLYSVAFHGTDFWADSFANAQGANDFADAWKATCLKNAPF